MYIIVNVNYLRNEIIFFACVFFLSINIYKFIINIIVNDYETKFYSKVTSSLMHFAIDAS